YEQKLATPQDARRKLGSNLVLVPSFAQRENRLTARLELREPVRSRRWPPPTAPAPAQRPFPSTDGLYPRAWARRGRPFRPRRAQADLGIRGAGTLRFLFQGIGRRRVAESLESRQRALADFETAYRTEPDPSSPRTWLALAQTTMFGATQDTTWLARAEA